MAKRIDTAQVSVMASDYRLEKVLVYNMEFQLYSYMKYSAMYIFVAQRTINGSYFQRPSVRAKATAATKATVR